MLAALILAAGVIAPPPPVAIVDGRDALAQVLTNAGAGGAPVVVHFWATWCPPCVKELPHLVKSWPALEKAGARIVFISVDATRELERKVGPALRKAGVKAPSWILENVEFDAVGQLLDPAWDGTLPATFVLKNGRPTRAFFGPVKDLRVLRKAVLAAR